MAIRETATTRSAPFPSIHFDAAEEEIILCGSLRHRQWPTPSPPHPSRVPPQPPRFPAAGIPPASPSSRGYQWRALAPTSWRPPSSRFCFRSTEPCWIRWMVKVDKYVRSGMVVGLGSGRASGLAIQYLGQRLREGSLKDVVGVPTSVSSASKAAMAGIPLDNYQENLQIDFAFDDADIIDKGTLTAVIGRRKLDGAESIIEEKSIIKRASGLAFIVTENQYTGELGGSIPVLITSGNWLETAEQIDDLFLGDAEVWRRSLSGGAGPLGGDFPFVTKEGHHVLDVIFTSPILDLGQVAESLDQVDGVVDHGIICRIPCIVIVASKEGLEVVDNLSKNQTTDSS